MSFGQKVLEKYGWRKGDGLGKSKDGMKEPIKTKLKANNLGLGFKLGAEFQDNWWENVYNEAASNITLGDEMNSSQRENKEYLPHKKKANVKNIKEGYNLFTKNSKEDISSEEEAAADNKMSDDAELFKKCGGRTVHKGARHGLTLSGKLERLEKQDKELLNKMKKSLSKNKRKRL